MLKNVFVRAGVIERFQQNPLGPSLELLATNLHELGYASSSIQDGLRASAKFGRWLQHQGHAFDNIDCYF